MPGIQPGISYIRILMYFSVMKLSIHFCRQTAEHLCTSVCLRLFHQIVQRCHACAGCPLAFKRIGGCPAPRRSCNIHVNPGFPLTESVDEQSCRNRSAASSSHIFYIRHIAVDHLFVFFAIGKPQITLRRPGQGTFEQLIKRIVIRHGSADGISQHLPTAPVRVAISSTLVMPSLRIP